MLNKLARAFGFSRHSSYLLSAFLLTCGLIVYIWWPLVAEYFSTYDPRFAWYLYIDWLLIGIFSFMSLSIMVHANLSRDGLIVLVGIFGGLVIESWGTQTNLWHYYTAERPPLWIIPAWPIASLSIDRIARSLMHLSVKWKAAWFRPAYWFIFLAFYILMLSYIAPTLNKSYSLAALLICALFILTPTNYRMAVFTFLAGSALGYFLELWGTTRECWLYYTGETPPIFAVFAHGMAAVAFWRTGLLMQTAWQFIKERRALLWPNLS